MAGIEVLRCLHRFTYRRGVLPEMGIRQEHFKRCVEIARQVSLRRLARPRELSRIDQMLDLLGRDFQTIG